MTETDARMLLPGAGDITEFINDNVMYKQPMEAELLEMEDGEKILEWLIKWLMESDL